MGEAFALLRLQRKPRKAPRLVVSRERTRRFEDDQAIDVMSAGEETIRVVRELSEEVQEACLSVFWMEVQVEVLV